MFVSCFLKKILPFALTFILGSALSGLFSFLSFHRADPPKRYWSARGGGACRAFKSAPARANSTRAVINFQPSARYTDAARRNNFTGRARMRVLLGADGTVSEVEPLHTLPYGLTGEAVRAAKEIKFAPATVDGRPVSTWAYVEQEFVDARTMTTISKVTSLGGAEGGHSGRW